MTGYVDSFYARTRIPAEPRRALAGTVEVDVAIVGGGLAGLTAAIELSRAGRKVAVLEAERIGWGASGRNGGFVSPGYATGLSHIEAMAGREAALALYRLSIEGVRIVEENLAGFDQPRNVPTYGKLSVLRYADAPALRAQQERMARDFGYALEFRDREQVRSVLRSTKYHEEASLIRRPSTSTRSITRSASPPGSRHWVERCSRVRPSLPSISTAP